MFAVVFFRFYPSLSLVHLSVGISGAGVNYHFLSIFSAPKKTFSSSWSILICINFRRKDRVSCSPLLLTLSLPPKRKHVLISPSPFTKNLLFRSPHPSPLVRRLSHYLVVSEYTSAQNALFIRFVPFFSPFFLFFLRSTFILFSPPFFILCKNGILLKIAITRHSEILISIFSSLSRLPFCLLFFIFLTKKTTSTDGYESHWIDILWKFCK